MSPLVKFRRGRCLPCKQGRMGLDVGGWPFPVGVATDHPAPSCCCRNTPLSRSPSPSGLLQRLTRLCAARTMGVCFNAEARAPLMRFLQRPPLHRRQPFASCCPLRRAGEEVANLLRSAVLAVSHDRDGFVRRRPCGLVASHCRPWGSPGFLPTIDCRRCPTFPSGRLTLRSLPLPTRGTPSPRPCRRVHRMSRPSRGWPSFVLRTGRNLHALRKSPPPQGFPDRESVAEPPRCRDGLPVAPLGFSPTPGLHLSFS